MQKGEKQRWNFEGEEKRKQEEDTDFEEKGLWGNRRENTSKLQENGLFCLLKKTWNQTQAKKHKKEGLRTPFCMLKHNPLFLTIFSATYTLFSAKAVFCSKHCFQQNTAFVDHRAETPSFIVFSDLYDNQKSDIFPDRRPFFLLPRPNSVLQFVGKCQF